MIDKQSTIGAAFALLPLLVAVFLLTGQPVRADQNEPGLNALFEQLQTATRQSTESIKKKIRADWNKHPDAEITRLISEGESSIGAREYGRAMEIYTRITEKAPEFAEGWNKLATVSFLVRDHAHSVLYIQKTLALEPRHFGALSGMGLIFLEKGDFNAAQTAFQEVLKISPESGSARYYSDQLLEYLGKQI